MVIELDGKDTLKIILDRRDMRRLNITFEELDYGSRETQEVLRELLADAGKLTGFSAKKISKMLIEVFPAPAGGCLLYFTKISAPRQAVISDTEASADFIDTRESNLYVYELDCGGDLLAAMDYIKSAENRLPAPEERRIFSRNDIYRMIFKWNIPKNEAASVLCEFARYIGSGKHAAALTEEHWQAIQSK